MDPKIVLSKQKCTDFIEKWSFMSILACLYKRTGRAIAVTVGSGSELTLADLSVSASALVKVFG